MCICAGAVFLPHLAVKTSQGCGGLEGAAEAVGWCHAGRSLSGEVKGKPELAGFPVPPLCGGAQCLQLSNRTGNRICFVQLVERSVEPEPDKLYLPSGNCGSLEQMMKAELGEVKDLSQSICSQGGTGAPVAPVWLQCSWHHTA